MTILRRMPALAVATLLLASTVAAEGIAGTWTAEFDTQVGVQKYTFAFALEGGALSGTARFERMGETGEAELEDCALEGDAVSFVEPFSFQGTSIPITYSGVLDGDEIAFSRRVGDFAEEKFTATRVAE